MFLITLTDETIKAGLESVQEEMFVQIKYSDFLIFCKRKRPKPQISHHFMELQSINIHKTTSFSAEQRAELGSLESVFVIYFSLVEDL